MFTSLPPAPNAYTKKLLSHTRTTSTLSISPAITLTHEHTTLPHLSGTICLSNSISLTLNPSRSHTLCYHRRNFSLAARHRLSASTHSSTFSLAHTHTHVALSHALSLTLALFPIDALTACVDRRPSRQSISPDAVVDVDKPRVQVNINKLLLTPAVEGAREAWEREGDRVSVREYA